MIENLVYVIAGFAITYVSLEVAWHFAACRLKGYGKIKPCMFKEIKTLFTAPLETRGGRVY
jgi:hypothetical protein